MILNNSTILINVEYNSKLDTKFSYFFKSNNLQNNMISKNSVESKYIPQNKGYTLNCL